MSEGLLTRLKRRAGARWKAVQERRPSIRHVVGAWGHMQGNNGNQYAAAITFFSFLALFPLLLLAVSVTGFVLHSHPALQQDFFNHLTDQLPGGLGKTLRTSLEAAIRNRGSLGIVGLVGVLLTGLGWIGNVRTAIDAVWGRTPPAMNFFKARIANLLVLAGLGLGAVVSLGLTVVGTSVTDQILRALGLDNVTGAAFALKLLGIALALAGDMVIFWWLIFRLPQIATPTRIVVKTALLAAIGFEVLKVLGTYTVAHTANSPTAGPFAGILAVLIWMQLVARFLLFSCAWAATLTAEHRDTRVETARAEEQAAVPQPEELPEEQPEISPAAVGASLVAAGAVAGAAAAWALTRPRSGPT